MTCALLGLNLPGQPGLAEEPMIEEIIVTAQKRTQSQQEVPIAITAIGAEDLELAAVSNFSELQFKVPIIADSTQFWLNPPRSWGGSIKLLLY